MVRGEWLRLGDTRTTPTAATTPGSPSSSFHRSPFPHPPPSLHTITTTLRPTPLQGAYALYSVPLLENGVRSGMRVANSLGCKVPWSGSVGAEEDANSAWVGGQGKPSQGHIVTVGLLSVMTIAAIAGMKANLRR